MERWHNPQTHEGREVPSSKHIAERKQNIVHHKEKVTKHTVMCHSVNSLITLATPRLAAEQGVGRTTKKN